jgi:hypothetical protein
MTGVDCDDRLQACTSSAHEEAAPASINQDARLASEWLGRLSATQNGRFHIAVCLLLEGTLNTGALERAIDIIVQRHGALRSRFADLSRLSRQYEHRLLAKMADPDGWREYLFPQHICASASVGLSSRRVAASALDVTSAAFRALMNEEIARPFRYDRAPLIRATLFESDRDRVLLLVFHHLVMDGWSTSVFLTELALVYAQLAASVHDPVLIEVPMQYVDFVRRQRATLDQPSGWTRLQRWQQSYQEWLPCQLTFADVPSLRCQGPPAGGELGVRTVSCATELAQGIKAFCRGRGVTLYMFGVTALFALCHFHAGRETVAMRAVFANRPRGSERSIGWMAEGRVLGVSVRPTCSFNNLLDQVRQLALDAIADQDIPMGAIQHVSHRRSARVAGAHPIHLSLRLDDADDHRKRKMADGLWMTPIRVPHSSWHSNVLRVVLDARGDMRLRAAYAAQRLSGAGVESLLHQLRDLMRQCIAAPSRPLALHEVARQTRVERV